MNTLKLTLLIAAAGTLSACSVEGTRAYQGPNDFIAVAGDLGRDSSGNVDDNAAIAVTPDGCHAWIIDDGVDGRASNRLDPVSGLPVCGGGEPGVVYGEYQSSSQGIADRVPGEPVNVRVDTVPVRTYQGFWRPVHDVSEPHDH